MDAEYRNVGNSEQWPKTWPTGYRHITDSLPTVNYNGNW